jgi:hypothetical protein
MLSKCANPECSAVFRYLHEGKIFHLCPTPEVQAAAEILHPQMYERFWLCEKCSKQMTVVWGGTQAKLVSLASRNGQAELALVSASGFASGDDGDRGRPKSRAAFAGLDDG